MCADSYEQILVDAHLRPLRIATPRPPGQRLCGIPLGAHPREDVGRDERQCESGKWSRDDTPNVGSFPLATECEPAVPKGDSGDHLAKVIALNVILLVHGLRLEGRVN